MDEENDKGEKENLDRDNIDKILIHEIYNRPQNSRKRKCQNFNNFVKLVWKQRIYFCNKNKIRSPTIVSKIKNKEETCLQLRVCKTFFLETLNEGK